MNRLFALLVWVTIIGCSQYEGKCSISSRGDLLVKSSFYGLLLPVNENVFYYNKPGGKGRIKPGEALISVENKKSQTKFAKKGVTISMPIDDCSLRLFERVQSWSRR